MRWPPIVLLFKILNLKLLYELKLLCIVFLAFYECQLSSASKLFSVIHSFDDQNHSLIVNN